MEASYFDDDTESRLTTDHNPELSGFKKSAPNLTFKDHSQNSYQDTNSAIVYSWVGIVAAGGLFPVLVIPGSWLCMVYFNGLPTDFEIEDVFSGIVGLFFPAILGMFFAAIASLLSSLFTVTINWTFGNILTPRVAVSVCGGLAGFILTIPILFGPGFDPIFAFILILAIVMGHIGAIFSVWKIDPALLIRRPSTKPSYQFRIRHMFVATAWFAVIAAIDGMSGNFFLLAMLATWLAVQAVLISADFLWLKLWKRKSSIRISPTKTSL